MNENSFLNTDYRVLVLEVYVLVLEY